jgi:uncharacterized protein (TIGR03084 family)
MDQDGTMNANPAMDVFGDLAAEHEQIDAVLSGLAPGDWERPSAATGWSVADVVLHLAQTEELVVTAAQGQRPSFAPDPGGPSLDELADQAVAGERGAPGGEVLRRWRAARTAALATLRACPPGARLPWATSPLSPTTLATTRIAEHWAHALDITGPLGLPYPDTARLRHIAWLAYRTLPYAFALTGRHAGEVRCELTGPGGEAWVYGPDGAPSAITGPAGAFCRVAARRLPPAGAGLAATGPDGAAALAVLRTYAA